MTLYLLAALITSFESIAFIALYVAIVCLVLRVIDFQKNDWIGRRIQFIKHGDWEDSEWAGWTAPGWYFWDETDAGCVGPFTTKRKARKVCRLYYNRL